jgi:4,5-dihydroxyphthalate decarboxylase
MRLNSGARTVELSVALTVSERTRPVLAGEVAAEGIDLIPTALAPGEMFWRQLKHAEFDVSEMSVASLMIASTHGPIDWVALPVFTWREFFHTALRVRTDSPITDPKQLIGKKVGVKEYQQTAALWTRGALLHEFGVAPEQIAWYMERLPDRSHGGSTAFQAPEELKFSYVGKDRNLGQMLIDGEIDALTFYLPAQNTLDRSIVLEGNPAVRWLFPDAIAEGARYYRKTGIFPLNHCVVVRKSLVERHPWIPLNLYSMFVEAKQLSEERFAGGFEQWVRTGVFLPDVTRTIAEDPMKYGVRSNITELTTIGQYLHEQHLAPRVVDPGEIFYPGTMTL